MTATATIKTKTVIVEYLELIADPLCIESSPEKENIRYAVQPTATDDLTVTFSWLMQELKEKRELCDKYLIFCRSRIVVQKLYRMFVNEFEDEQYIPGCAINDDRNRLFAMYHSQTQPEVKSSVQTSFTSADGTVRIVFATIAFGMGVNVQKLYTVIHYGPSDDLDDYVQESGRVGRDGKQSHAIILKHRYALSGSRLTKTMKDYVKNNETCRRVALFSVFPGEVTPLVNKHLCCDICHSNCSCKDCKSGSTIEYQSSAELNFKASFAAHKAKETKQRVHYIPDAAKQLLQNDLLIYREDLIKSQNADSIALYTGVDLVCGLSITTVNRIIDDSEFISGIADIWDKYGVLEYSTAEKLWEIIKSHVNESVVSEKDEKPLVSQSSSESETDVIYKVRSVHLSSDSDSSGDD